jgi:hypothetical protein
MEGEHTGQIKEHALGYGFLNGMEYSGLECNLR